ncbi:hypothetical protein GGS23DRAFT_269027 [Durotheca rogersii]|uniref:uncharacterized protein n=1 Tax=Durotheca rogersii TaxID=419775 RepID=UPI002220790F|nr:uncharacterized protein GGS23DRAFT_269027 [Durotheca rogersii]KAI5859756.1 hypothetical protein GGS23DRAFT_269027 [Durotheca rogersii]
MQPALRPGRLRCWCVTYTRIPTAFSASLPTHVSGASCLLPTYIHDASVVAHFSTPSMPSSFHLSRVLISGQLLAAAPSPILHSCMKVLRVTCQGTCGYICFFTPFRPSPSLPFLPRPNGGSSSSISAHTSVLRFLSRVPYCRRHLHRWSLDYPYARNSQATYLVRTHLQHA